MKKIFAYILAGIFLISIVGFASAAPGGDRTPHSNQGSPQSTTVSPENTELKEVCISGGVPHSNQGFCLP